MNAKKLVIASVVLIAITGAIIVVNNQNSKSSSDKTNLFFPGIQKTLASFHIIEKIDTVRVFKKNDTWLVEKLHTWSPKAPSLELSLNSPKEKNLEDNGYPAESAAVANAIEKLGNLKKEVLISENPEKQSLFQVDSTGLLIELFDAGKTSLGSFRIGKNGPDWTTYYVRMNGSNQVYGVSGSIRYSFFIDGNRWRDMTICKFDSKAIKTLTLQRERTNSIILDKISDSLGGQWEITTPERCKAKSNEANEMVNGLSNFLTTSWANDSTATDSSMGFQLPNLVILISLKNGENKKITIGKMDPITKFYYVRSDYRPMAIFTVGEKDIVKLDKKFVDLKEPAQAPVQ